MIEVFILAIALSMDAFAVSVGLGSKKTRHFASLAILSALYFGVFQAIMPFVGYFAGKGVLSWIEAYAHWIAFLLLIIIGGKMIYEAVSEGIEEDIAQITHKVMLILALATSIDAMAAGFTLNLLDVNFVLACLIIGLITSVFSYLGVIIGTKSGTWLESKAELFGGVILILIGFKFLFI